MNKPRPYVDRGRPGQLRYQDGELLRVPDPPPAPMKILMDAPPPAAGEGVDVHAALERWAAWVIGSLRGTGWPNKTLLARVIEYGALGAAQGHYGSLMIVGTIVEYDELCAWVETAILRLAIEEREVVVGTYLSWGSAEVTAKQLGISRGTYDSRLSRARRSVKDYLDGRKASALVLQENIA